MEIKSLEDLYREKERLKYERDICKSELFKSLNSVKSGAKTSMVKAGVSYGLVNIVMKGIGNLFSSRRSDESSNFLTNGINLLLPLLPKLVPVVESYLSNRNQHLDEDEINDQIEAPQPSPDEVTPIEPPRDNPEFEGSHEERAVGVSP